MPSPAQLHRQRMLARQVADHVDAGQAGPRPQAGAAASAYRMLLAKLGADQTRLRDIQSVEGKIELKAQLIDEFDAHVDATLAASAQSGKAVQDEIVATMMLWRLDIGDFARGLDIAEHVLRFRLDMPPNIRRTPATLIAEEVAEAALKADRIAQPFDLHAVDRAMSLTQGDDMPDQVRAKLFKARGRLLLREASSAKDSASAPAGALQSAQREALAAFQRAFALDDGSGVKKDMERLSAKVSNQENNGE